MKEGLLREHSLQRGRLLLWQSSLNPVQVLIVLSLEVKVTKSYLKITAKISAKKFE